MRGSARIGLYPAEIRIGYTGAVGADAPKERGLRHAMLIFLRWKVSG